MLNRLPRFLPPFPELLADIGHPPPCAVARALGVSPRTVRRWLSSGAAPRPVALALWQLTRWGMHAVNAEAVTLATLRAGEAAMHRDEAARLRRELARVLALGDFGSANAPTLAAVPITAAQPRPTAVSSTRAGPVAGR